MGHNRSTSRARANVLAALLSGFARHLLEVDCGPGCPCPTGRMHRIANLLARYPSATVGDVVSRLKCGVCRKPPASIILVKIVDARRMPLSGPEAAY